MAALSLWWVSLRAVNCHPSPSCPLLPSGAFLQLRAGTVATCCPAACGGALGLGCSWVGCFFPLLLKRLQPQQRQQLLVAPPSSPAGGTQTRCPGCADPTAPQPAPTFHFAAWTCIVAPKYFPSLPSQQPSAHAKASQR